MKIFFIIKAIHHTGGTERVTSVIANELANRNHEVGIVSIVGGEQPFFPLYPKVSLHYIYPKKDKRVFPVKDILRYITLRKIFKTENPDIIIIVDAGRSFLKIPATRGFTTITWEHFNVNVNWQLIHPLSRRIAAKYSEAIVTLTNQDAESYMQKFGARKAVCIPNPITITVKEPSPLTQKLVLAVGRYSTQKGFDLLLDAWRKVRQKDNGWKLRIVGSGKEEAILKNKIHSYHIADSVELTTPKQNITAEYLQASIFVLSSRFEGLPLVLIEAMAMGLPIVSFDCETGPRDIIENNVTGILVPPLDVNQFAIELDSLMTDEKRRTLFSQNALKSVKKFDITRIVNMWESLFHELKLMP